MNQPPEVHPTIPGLEPPTLPAGSLEAEVRRQVTKLQDLGYIEDHHAGLVALATATAADIDRTAGRGAPSGRANLLRVMNEILQTLPQPEMASKSKLDEVVDAMLHDDEDDVEVPVVRTDA